MKTKTEVLAAAVSGSRTPCEPASDQQRIPPDRGRRQRANPFPLAGPPGQREGRPSGITKAGLSPQTARHALRDSLLCLWLWVLAAGLPVAVLGQANYATPYTFITIAGKAGIAGGEDGTGSAARFGGPDCVAVDSAGNVYVADAIGCTIRKVTPGGVVTTLAGVGGADGDGNPLHPGSADGTGSVARFNYPEGVAVDSAGNVYVGDKLNYIIRKGFPASSVPPPILQPPNLIAGKFGFGITGLPGLAVYIESSANMSSWLPLGSTIYILVGGTNYVVSPVPPQGTRFFRAHVN